MAVVLLKRDPQLGNVDFENQPMTFFLFQVVLKVPRLSAKSAATLPSPPKPSP